MTSDQQVPKGSANQAALLDDTQYQLDAIEKYEAIYGRHFISPGGADSARQCIAALEIRPGMSVLDVGCGLGGSAFLMAREHGAQVLGIDLSANMLNTARQRLLEEKLASQVRLTQIDVMELAPPPLYERIYSRDVFLHIHDKPALLALLRSLLKPGGVLFFTDYCRGEASPSQSFAEYIAQRQYDLRTVAQYQKLLEQAGFVDAQASDRSDDFIGILRTELSRIGPGPAHAEIRQSWLDKIDRASRGEQGWCWCVGRNPVN